MKTDTEYLESMEYITLYYLYHILRKIREIRMLDSLRISVLRKKYGNYKKYGVIYFRFLVYAKTKQHASSYLYYEFNEIVIT